MRPTHDFQADGAMPAQIGGSSGSGLAAESTAQHTGNGSSTTVAVANSTERWLESEMRISLDPRFPYSVRVPTPDAQCMNVASTQGDYLSSQDPSAVTSTTDNQ